MDADKWKAILDEPGYEWEPLGPGATEQELAELAGWIGRPLPDDYVALLRLANGAGVSYDRVWDITFLSTRQVPEYSRDYQIGAPHLPGAVLFASASEGLVFDTRPQHPDGRYPIYSVDYISVGDGWEAAIHVADSFRDLLLLRDRLLHEVQPSRAGHSNHHAFLDAELRCPHCGAVFGPLVLLHWGDTATISTLPRRTYQVGDPIAWGCCRDGTIRAWAYFADGELSGRANLGDPAVTDLITRDVTQFSPPPHQRQCQTCGQVLGGAAVEIRGGIIQRAWIYPPGELDDTATDFLIQPDGTLQPMPEWANHPLDWVTDC